MKTLLYVLISGTLIFTCNKDRQNKIAKSQPQTSIPSNTESKADYTAFKDSVLQHKKKLVGLPYKEVSDYFFTLINNEIFSYWKGTPWDFYGTTRTPGTGSIACGYFVTTTLEDIGLKIQRKELAECRSGDMIKALCTDIHTFRKLEKLEAFLKAQPKNSIYIIGLDNHTGYIIKDSNNSYFMHSYYANNQGVIKEKVKESPMLLYNKFFMIGSLTANKKLLEKWVSE